MAEPAREAGTLRDVQGGAPPFHIAHGTADRHVPFRQSPDPAAALDQAGADVRLTAVEGADRMWANMADPGPVFRAPVRFAQLVTG